MPSACIALWGLLLFVDQERGNADLLNFSFRINFRLIGHELQELLNSCSTNRGRVLRDGGIQFARLNGFDSIAVAVSSDNYNIGAGVIDGFLRAHGHGVVGCVDGLQIGVLVQVVLREVEGLGAVPVSGLALNNIEACCRERFFSTIATVNTGRNTGLTFNNGDLSFGTNQVDDVFAGHLADFYVVSSNESLHGSAEADEVVNIDGLVNINDVNASIGCLGDCVVEVHVRNGCYADCVVALRDGVFYQSNLALDVIFGVRCVNV